MLILYVYVDEDIGKEKEKLYQAIGYSKDSKLPDYPKEVNPACTLDVFSSISI